MSKIYYGDGTSIEVQATESRPTPFKVCMHRGGCGTTTTLPEETIPAFYESGLTGVEYFEVDAVSTSDGTIICCHANPITDKDGTEWSISGNTWETLSSVVLATVGSYGNIGLCTLENALRYCYFHGKSLVIDSINSADEATTIAKMVSNAGMAGKVVYMLVFHTTDVAEISAAILAVDNGAKIAIDYNSGLTYAKAPNSDSNVIVLVKKAYLTDDVLKEIRDAGFPWYLWDVNVSDDITEYVAYRPDYFQFMQGDDPDTRIHAVIDSLDFGKGID